MQKDRQNRRNNNSLGFSDLDLIGAAGAVIVFVGVSAKAAIEWLLG